MSRIFLGPRAHWAVLAAFVAVLWTMGTLHLHVRAFAAFVLALLGMVFVALSLIVARHRAGDVVTRESFGDARLPHAAREVDEV